MCTLEFYHYDELTWPEIVFELIQFTQKLGSGWSLVGNIDSEFSAILSRQSGNHIIISGLQWAEWQVINPHEA